MITIGGRVGCSAHRLRSCCGAIANHPAQAKANDDRPPPASMRVATNRRT